MTAAEELTIQVEPALHVSALWQASSRVSACLVLAHGAGAGMRHPFLAEVAAQLAERDIATLRYQFPYMERRSKRPDPPRLCHATVRAAVAEAARRSTTPLFAGGRSFGGRMTSQAQSATPLPRVQGLAFLGFPLHSAKKPSRDRAEHLSQVHVPMLFLQGTRDELAELSLIELLTHELGPGASLRLFTEADHSFHVPARSGRTDAQVLSELIEALTAWIEQVRPGPIAAG